jgi:predicted metal-dependent HD superfamily phosphohydrolase
VSQESPALDRSRWSSLWSRLGARDDSLSVFQRLAAAYADPGRAYHNTTHILDCLAELDRSVELAHNPDEVEAALWFHDAVYLPGAPENEDRSARLAQESLRAAGVPPDSCQRIADLILATRHVSASGEPDAQLVCDIDLAILGRPGPEYDEFERRIRCEYAWVPAPLYRKSRSDILTGFLRRPAIYQTSLFAARYEFQARQNLQRALRMLAS